MLFCEMNDDTPRAGNAICPFRRINKVVDAKNSSEFITHISVGLTRRVYSRNNTPAVITIVNKQVITIAL